MTPFRTSARESLLEESEPVVAEEKIVSYDERRRAEDTAPRREVRVLRQQLAVFGPIGGFEKRLSVQTGRVALGRVRGLELVSD